LAGPVAAAADWETANVWPAMVSVPERELVVPLAATEKVVVPLPVPLAPAVIVIQVAPLVAVQLQPLVAVTLELPLPPPDENEALEGEIEKVQVGLTSWAVVALAISEEAEEPREL